MTWQKGGTALTDDVPKPLLFDEIMTISLYGTPAEQTRLDEYLSREYSDELELEIYALAERIRDRRQLWMRWRCCRHCRFFSTCILKWIKQERDIPSTCCFRCERWTVCVERYRAGKSQKEATGDAGASATKPRPAPPAERTGSSGGKDDA